MILIKQREVMYIIDFFIVETPGDKYVLKKGGVLYIINFSLDQIPKINFS